MFRRVRASTYLFVMSMAINVWCIAMIVLFEFGISDNVLSSEIVSYLRWGFGALVGYLFFKLSKGRLQDLNCDAKWARVLAFPLFAVVVLPLLCTLSGEPYSNDFGDPPAPSNFIRRLAALLSFAFALWLVSYVTQLYRTGHAI